MDLKKASKIDYFLKILGGIVFVVSILVLISQIIISQNIFVVLISGSPLIMLIVSWKVMKNVQNYKNIKKGAIIGSLFGGGISLAIIATMAFESFYSGYWRSGDFQFVFFVGNLSLGYLSIIVGAALGMLISWNNNKIKSMNSSNSLSHKRPR